MLKKIILLSGMLLLSACGDEVYWRYGMTDEQTARDTKTCHQQALKAVPEGTGDYSAIKYAEKTCMAQKGYYSSLTKPPFLSLRAGERDN